MDNISFHRKQTQDTVKTTTLAEVKGFDPTTATIKTLLAQMKGIGFQATQLGIAADIIKKMQDDAVDVYLSCTSNIVSSGLREVIAHLVKNKKIVALITSTGSIEEDIMKTMEPFRVGSFEARDEELQANKLNRIGNIFVSDDQYCNFEDLHMKFIEECYNEKQIWAPSEYIKKFGLQLKDENSILYWAARNDIPIIVPGMVDGAMGDHFFFFNEKHKNKPFIIDTTADVTNFYKQILASKKTGGVILGGGIAKHHLIGAAILRDGLDYAVYVSTGTQYDGSLSGAKPHEAISWNKIKERDSSVHIEADATLVFPLLALHMLS